MTPQEEPKTLKRIEFGQVREIRKQQALLDPEWSADRDNSMVQAGADTQLKADQAQLEEILAEERKRIFGELEARSIPFKHKERVGTDRDGLVSFKEIRCRLISVAGLEALKRSSLARVVKK